MVRWKIGRWEEWKLGVEPGRRWLRLVGEGELRQGEWQRRGSLVSGALLAMSRRLGGMTVDR